MPRRSTCPSEPLQTFLGVVNGYTQKGVVSPAAWKKLLKRCGCGESRSFDIRQESERDASRSELVEAVRDVLNAIIDRVKRGGSQVSIKIPVEESLEIRPP